jgi:hypothetical protein
VPPVRAAAAHIVENIRRSGLTIYDEIEVGDPNLWLPAPELESDLDAQLRGLKLGGYPRRTRSKVVKQAVCTAFGYPIPSSFRRLFPTASRSVLFQKSSSDSHRSLVAVFAHWVLIKSGTVVGDEVICVHQRVRHSVPHQQPSDLQLREKANSP